jgi:membrane protein required for colicin V production
MPTDLTGFDYVVLALIGLLAVMGLVRGLVVEAMSLAAWVAGGVVVRLFHHPVTAWLAPRTGGEASAAAVAFLLLFFGTVILGRLLAGLLGGATRRVGLGGMDRVLGLGFGAVKGVILASILFLLVGFATSAFDPGRRPPDWLVHARATPLLRMSAKAMVGWVGEWQAPAAAVPGLPPHAAPGASDRGAPGPGASDSGGYSAADRAALDRLLEDGKGTDI